jgi:prolyl oligopeptidase
MLGAPRGSLKVKAHVLRYPTSRVQEVRETFHGIEVVDPYRWLEDPSTSETRQWLAAQDRLTRKVLSTLPHRSTLRQEFSSLACKDLLPLWAPPLPPRTSGKGTGPRYFQLRRPPRAQQPVLYCRDGPRGRPRVVVDPQREGPGSTTSILQVSPSWDGSKVLFGLSVDGSDRTSLKVRGISPRQDLDRISNVRYAHIAWLHDGSGFYYSNWPEPGMAGGDGRPHVFFHRMGTATSSDPPIFGEGLETTQLVADLVLDPHDDHLVILVERLSASSDLYHRDLRRGGNVRPLVTGLGSFFVDEGSMAIREGRVIAVTDHRAPHRRVVSIPIESPAVRSWRELVPETDDILQGMAVIGGQMVLRYLEGASSRLKVFNLDGTPTREILLPGLGTALGPLGEAEGGEAVFAFTSFQVPTTLYRCRLSGGPPTVLDRSPIPSPQSWLTTRQVRYRSKDHTEVSMCIVHRTGLHPEGHAPALLEGYGGFGYSFTPSFDYGVLPFLRDGGVYAVPNLRGGGEYGKTWHDGGKLERKQNVFDDFAGAAEWLIAEGYSDPAHLAMKGLSNGGLLVGALITQRPELFRAAVCGVPVLDMLRYHLFDGGSLWVPEYGSSEDPGAFQYLWKYSPYHRVRPGVRYPAVLLTTADTDTRVNPLHARKMAARLQASSSSGLPVLLRTQRKGGHGFGKSVQQTVEELTDIWTFLYDQLGVVSRSHESTRHANPS